MEEKKEDIIEEQNENLQEDIMVENNEEKQEDIIPEDNNDNNPESEEKTIDENDDKEDKENVEKKEINIVDGDGSTLVISPVYEHIGAAKPKVNDKDPKKIIIPDEKKIDVDKNEDKKQ